MSVEKPSILIVEDEEIVALDIQTELETLGYDVVGRVRSAEEAIVEAEHRKPDLALMDIQLEGLVDGIEAAREIRCRFDIPIVFLTAYSDEELLSRAEQVQPHGYLVKPFDRRDLKSTLQMAVYKGRVDRQLRRAHADFQAILDAQRQGTVMLDKEGCVTLLNRAAQRILGKEMSAAQGKPWREVLKISDGTVNELQKLIHSPPCRQTKIATTLQTRDDQRMPVELEVVRDPRDRDRAILFLYDMSELHQLRRQLDENARYENMIGKSKPIQRVFALVEQLAQVDSTVLIEGETGTGKELVARAIHRRSSRAKEPLVALNCGGLSEELAASQLFGHRRGAFTGASDSHEGLFEKAGRGTIFLDEISELPPRVQATLLRVLEDRTVMRVGDTQERPVRARVIAASNRNLARESEKKRFRPDLLYRIRVARIELPPLRERIEDLPLLARGFLAACSAAAGKDVRRIDDETMGFLMQYGWPGNVRELKNAVEFAVIRCQGEAILPENLPPEILDWLENDPAENSQENLRGRILAALEQTGNNRKKAASVLGMSRATFYRRLAELRLLSSDS